MKKSIVSILLCSLLSTAALPAICLADGGHLECVKKKKTVKPIKVAKKSLKKKKTHHKKIVKHKPAVVVAREQFVFNRYSPSSLENHVLREVNIVGSSVIPSNNFRPYYENYLNHHIGFQDINEICSKITDDYRSKGYILSGADPQKARIMGGVLTINVVEGAVNDVLMEKNVMNNKLLDTYMDRIKAEQPLTKKNYEYNMLLAKELPGINAHSYFQPSNAPDPRNVDMVLQSDKHELESLLAVNNYGRREDGRYNADLNLNFNSVFGKNSLLAVESTFANKNNNFRGVNTVYSLPFNSRGSKINVGVSYNDLHNPQTTYLSSNINSYVSEDVEGSSMQYALGVSHPFYLSRAFSFSAELDVIGRRDKVLNNTRLDIDNRFRIVRPGVVAKFANKYGGSLSIATHFHKGLSELGAKKNKYLSGTQSGDIDFKKYTLSIGAMQSFLKDFNFSVMMHGQLAGRTLLPSEKVSFGGRLIGRGFDPNYISGDMGLGVGLELNYVKTFSEQYIINAIEPYLFVDGAATRNKLDDQGPKSQKLISSGAGLKVIIAEHFASDIIAVRQLKRTNFGVDNSGKNKAMFNLSYNLNM